MTSPTINPFSTLLTDPIRNFRFLVEFLPHDTRTTAAVDFQKTIGFTNVSGFGLSVDPIAYREGGYNTTVHYLPGQTSFEPVSFTRGTVLGSNQNHQWMRQLFAVVAGRTNAGVGHDFRCNVDVSVISHPNPANTKTNAGDRATNPYDLHVSMRFRLYNAWISSLLYGDLNSGGAGLMVEGMTLVHEGFDVNYATGFADSAPKFTR
jgi:phage tail-like protein